MAEVTIYTRRFCIWCWRAKRLLRRRGVAFREVDAGDEETRAMLLARTGRPTVPQIFFGDRSVGGFDDLDALDRSGALSAQLSAV